MNGKLKAAGILVLMYGLGFGTTWVWHECRELHPRGPRSSFFENRVQRMKKDLHLSADQEQTVREIFRKANERATEINEEVSWDLMEIHRDSVQAIRAILTPDQSREFEKMHHRFHLHRRPFLDDDQGGPETASRENLRKARRAFYAEQHPHENPGSISPPPEPKR